MKRPYFDNSPRLMATSHLSADSVGEHEQVEKDVMYPYLKYKQIWPFIPVMTTVTVQDSAWHTLWEGNIDGNRTPYDDCDVKSLYPTENGKMVIILADKL